jgi:hypothetical protein
MFAFSLVEVLSAISFHLLRVHKGPHIGAVIVTSCFRRGQNSVQNTATKTDSMHQCSILHKQTDMMEKKK